MLRNSFVPCIQLAKRQCNPQNSRIVSATRTAACVSNRSMFVPLQFRSYRGEANDGASVLSPSEHELYERAKPRSEAIMANHIRMPDLSIIPESSFGNAVVGDDDMNTSSSTNIVKDDELALEIRKKRLIYRSKQRGWLEVDLLLGTWANTYVPTLNANELDQFEDFVNYETIDIYNIITLRLDVPDHLKTPTGTGVVERIQEWARTSPLGKADPDTYKKVKHDNNLI